ncbi:MAG TPA: ATP-binding protein [Gemmatimonadaceae bacterium]|nr:ATP-binding protein [Gemmatimonadaceae bacterium]
MFETAALIERLAQHRTVGSAPVDELAWLAEHGTLRPFARGELMFSKATVLDSLRIVLSGRFAIRVDRGAGPRKVLEWQGGDVAGLLPYSRMGAPPGDTVASESGEALEIGREHFPELTHRCPNVTAILVHVMLDRARQFVTSDLHDEKMMSLGRLSAGLAHELNNPASAAVRSAKLLGEAQAEVDAAGDAFGAAILSDSQRQGVHRLREICLAQSHAMFRSPIEQADREDAIAEWLSRHGASLTNLAAIAETNVRIEELDRFAAALAPAALYTPLRWIAAGCAVRALVAEIETATTRIYDLVAAVKRFTYMDRSPTPEIADLTQGLRDTLTVLGAKARSKSVTISLDVDQDLPLVRSYGGELNQVWVNLIDNALDAAPPSGRVSVTAAPEMGSVIVRVIDDGPGIPADVLPRIFDQFFTTKPVGQGTGLGLDIALRLVRRHDGDIEVDSRPGRTEFRVILPPASQTSGLFAVPRGPGPSAPGTA